MTTASSQSHASHSSDTILLELPEVGEFTRLSLWMAGSVAGIVSPTHAAQGRHFRDMARRLGWPPARRRRGDPPAGEAALAMLAEAFVGSTRWALGSVFGPPRYAVADANVSEAEAVCGARVWYYAIRHPGVSAVAVHYKGDVVDRVVFIGVD